MLITSAMLMLMIMTLMIMSLMMIMMTPGSRGEEITVTHQVPTRTVFTVIERGETKSLFADVLETSLEVGKLRIRYSKPVKLAFNRC